MWKLLAAGKLVGSFAYSSRQDIHGFSDDGSSQENRKERKVKLPERKEKKVQRQQPFVGFPFPPIPFPFSFSAAGKSKSFKRHPQYPRPFLPTFFLQILFGYYFPSPSPRTEVMFLNELKRSIGRSSFQNGSMRCKNKRLQSGMDAFSSSSSSDWDTLPKLTVSDLLNQISLELVPTIEHAKRCQEITLQLVAILEKELGPELTGHVMVAGSYGKGTAVANDSDYDIVIFFNKLEPPFNKVLNDMETSIKANCEKFNGFKWRFRSTIHVCFDVEGIRFDLTPAAQFDQNYQWERWCCFAPTHTTPHPTRQYTNTLKKITELNDPEKLSYLYSSSLSIDACVFVQRQYPFVHSVIRVAKHWAKHVNTGRLPIRGKSLLVETVALHACFTLSAIEMTDANMDRAFLTFLEYFTLAPSLRLYLYVNYQREDIPDKIFNQTPLVLDPSNPYNNLLSPVNFPGMALKCFQEAARITMRKVTMPRDGEWEDLSEFKESLCKFSCDR